jgi:hypothetical protein
MKNFEAIKELWKVQRELPINYDSIMKSVSSGQKRYAQKLIIQFVCVSIVLTIILSIWLFKPFFTWTTHLSMLVLCFCLAYFLIIQLRDYKKVRQFNQHLLKPEDFIEYLKAYKKDSYLLNKRNYKIYTFGLGFAFILILFEMYFILPFWIFLLFIIVTISWFILSYLFLMKEYIKTEKGRIENMISQLEKLKNQLKE